MQGGNGYDSKQLSGYLSEIDVADVEIERAREDFKAECEPYRERIRDVLTAAKDNGINMTAFKVVLAEHRAEKRMDRRVAALDIADRADYGTMCDALGILVDTPLGEAALRLARSVRDGTMTVEVKESEATADGHA